MRRLNRYRLLAPLIAPLFALPAWPAGAMAQTIPLRPGPAQAAAVPSRDPQAGVAASGPSAALIRQALAALDGAPPPEGGPGGRPPRWLAPPPPPPPRRPLGMAGPPPDFAVLERRLAERERQLQELQAGLAEDRRLFEEWRAASRPPRGGRGPAD